jgi:hypothetical protein
VSTDRRYARIYYDELEREFPDVWRDPVLRGEYTLLLAVADRAWPASPEVPRLARSAAVRRLAEAGLIFLEEPYHYRCRGMDKERSARRERAAHAAGVRYADRTAASTASGTAGSTASAMPNRAEPSRAEKSRADAPASDDRDALDTYHELTMWRPWGSWSGEKLRGLIATHGNEAVDAALRESFAKAATRDTLLDRAIAVLERNAERAKRDAEKRHKAELRAMEITPEQAAENQRRINAEVAKMTGKPAA